MVAGWEVCIFIWFLTTWVTVDNSSKCVFVLISLLSWVKNSHHSSCWITLACWLDDVTTRLGLSNCGRQIHRNRATKIKLPPGISTNDFDWLLLGTTRFKKIKKGQIFRRSSTLRESCWSFLHLSNVAGQQLSSQFSTVIATRSILIEQFYLVKYTYPVSDRRWIVREFFINESIQVQNSFYAR